MSFSEDKDPSDRVRVINGNSSAQLPIGSQFVPLALLWVAIAAAPPHHARRSMAS